MTRNLVRNIFFGLALSAAQLVPGSMAFADSLNGAMEAAYGTNPTLRAQRAGQRATDELVPQALSGWRPTVTVSGSLNRDYTEFSNGMKITDTGYGELAIQLQQPLFNGFKTVEGTKAAEARVEAGRQNLLAVEQSVLFEVVQAYMNVYAGRRLVALQRQNVAVLQGQLRASNERFKVGEITRTDVAQARASLAQAQASLTNVQATLAGDVAKYLQIVGKQPGNLSYPKFSKQPKSLRTALATASETSPNILAAAFVEVATQHDVGVARSALLPKAFLTASAFKRQNAEKDSLSTQGASISATVNIPLYQAGAVYSSVRQAKQLASQQRITVIEVARAVRQAVAASWNAYVALGDIITAARSQVSASELALDGVQQEYQAGTRTTLDVLNAQAAVVSAKTTLVTAQKNRILAGYQLLAATGRLTARDLGLKVSIYDPAENYDAVRNKWFGSGVETVE